MLLAIIALTVNLVIQQQQKPPHPTHTYIPKQKIPPTGLAEYDTKGEVLGNPQNGIDDLNRMYSAIKEYRAKHNDTCQLLTVVNGQKIYDYKPNLYFGAQEKPANYGFINMQEVEDIFHNPDTKFSNKERGTNALRYMTPCTRPDATFIGSAKALNTRDIYAYTDIYYYENRREFAHQKITQNPVGFYLVLWEDGEVAKFGYDEVLYAKTPARNSHVMIFPGQAGTYSEVLTYDQYYQKVFGMTRGPRGKAGSQGEVLDNLVAKKQ